jgi:hypothetical protein
MFTSAHPDNSEDILVIKFRRPLVDVLTATAEEEEAEDEGEDGDLDGDLNIEDYNSQPDQYTYVATQVFLSILEPILNI